jgi:hypothetical protein
MCKARTLSLIPNVRKAVKTATPAPNQDDKSCHAPRQPALDCVSSLSTLGHGGHSAVGVSFPRLP